MYQLFSDVTMAYSQQDKQWLEETIKKHHIPKNYLIFNQPRWFLNVGMKIKRELITSFSKIITQL